jgi:hypothetical protein
MGGRELGWEYGGIVMRDLLFLSTAIVSQQIRIASKKCVVVIFPRSLSLWGFSSSAILHFCYSTFKQKLMKTSIPAARQCPGSPISIASWSCDRLVLPVSRKKLSLVSSHHTVWDCIRRADDVRPCLPKLQHHVRSQSMKSRLHVPSQVTPACSSQV